MKLAIFSLINRHFSKKLFFLPTTPNYHYRPIGTYPESVGLASRSSKKLNLWCAISYRGATDFVVNIFF